MNERTPLRGGVLPEHNHWSLKRSSFLLPSAYFYSALDIGLDASEVPEHVIDPHISDRGL